MKTLTIKTTEGRTLETTSMVLTVAEIRQLWPDQYDESTADYTVTDADGTELTGEDAHIYLSSTPSDWCGCDPRPDTWGAWGVDAERDGLYTLYISNEGEGNTIYFAMSTEQVVAELQRIADGEKGSQELLDEDEQDYSYFNKIMDCIEAISKFQKERTKMKTLTIKTTEGRTLETSEQMFLTVDDIRQLWPDIYMSNYEAGEDYTVTDEDGNEHYNKIDVDPSVDQWFAEVNTNNNSREHSAWGVNHDGNEKFTLYLSSEGDPDIYYFDCSAEFVITELKKIADAEEAYQDSSDEDDQDYRYFNRTIDCIADIKKIKEA